MKNFIIIAISVVTLFSCGILKKKTSEDNSRAIEEKKTEQSNAVSKDNKESDNERKTASITEVEMLVFDKSSLPSDIKYTGNIVTGKRWNDKNGENILILSKTKVIEKKSSKSGNEENELECELFGYHYVNSGSSYSLLWKVQDYIKECWFDLTLDFIPGSLSITDLNNNGIAESTFLYKMACRSDVSPSELKLIMHENDVKYALRGNMLIKIEGYNQGGEYKVDKSFESAPEGFLEYAKSQWKEYRLETFN
ncbi:MAG: hypothetical protein WC139_04010 [Candidatus Kapaibacterium sp.]